MNQLHRVSFLREEELGMKTFVIGVFSFIGYALVEELLRQDKQVYGYHPKKELTAIEEEKLFQIGRNANFMYVESLEEEKSAAITYCCLYEPSKRLEENERAIVKEVIRKCLAKRCVLVSGELMCLEEIEKVCTIVNVPTVYGPWQPAYMTYHRLLQGEKVEESFYTVEDTSDVLYIDDVVKAILSVKKEGTIYLKSGKEKQWGHGIRLICGEEFEVGERQQEALLEREERVIEQTISLEVGIQKQREHIKKFSYLYKDK
jgi:hypothetical protein